MFSKKSTAMILLKAGLMVSTSCKLTSKSQVNEFGGGSSAQKQEGGVTFEGIIKYLEGHPDLYSMGTFLSDLPESYRRYFTLVYQNEGDQSADREEPKYPRVILFGSDSESS